MFDDRWWQVPQVPHVSYVSWRSAVAAVVPGLLKRRLGRTPTVPRVPRAGAVAPAPPKAEAAEAADALADGSHGSLADEVRGDFAALRTDAYMGVPLIYLDSGVGDSQISGCLGDVLCAVAAFASLTTSCLCRQLLRSLRVCCKLSQSTMRLGLSLLGSRKF